MHVLLNSPRVETEGPEPQVEASADLKDQTQSEPFVSVFEGDVEDVDLSLEPISVQSESLSVLQEQLVLGAFSELINQGKEADVEFPENTAGDQQEVPEFGQLVALINNREAEAETDGLISVDPKSLDRSIIESSKLLSQVFAKGAETQSTPAANGPTETIESSEVSTNPVAHTIAGALPDMLARGISREDLNTTPAQTVTLTRAETAKTTYGPSSFTGAVVSSEEAVAPVASYQAQGPTKADLPNAPRLADAVLPERAVSSVEIGTVQASPESITDHAETFLRAEKTAVSEERRNPRLTQGVLSVDERPAPSLSVPVQQTIERIDVSDRNSRDERSKFSPKLGRPDRGRDDVQLRGELPQRIEMSAPLKSAEAIMSEQSRGGPAPQILPLVDQSTFREAVREDASFGAATAGGTESSSTTIATARTQPEPVSARSIVTQVIQSITRVPGENSVEIRLQPEELGRVRLTLLPVEGGVSVQIAADRADTLDLLKRNVEMLEADLRKQGFSNASFSFGSGNSDEDNSPEAWSNDPAEEDASSTTKVEVGTRPVLKEAGRLDIRV